MRIFWHQLRAEQLLFWRSREAAVFTFIFPILLFLLLGSVYDGTIRNHDAQSVLLVGMLGYGAANTAFAGLAITLVIRRENAILKRLRSTPLPADVYLACVLVSTLIVFALEAILLIVLGRLLFDARLESAPGSLVVSIALGVLTFAAIGLGAASLIRSAEGSSAVVNVILLPMAFLSGSFGSTRDYPQFLRALGDVLPLKWFIELVFAVGLSSDHVWDHLGWVAAQLAWGAIGLTVALRYFRWEPREG